MLGADCHKQDRETGKHREMNIIGFVLFMGFTNNKKKTENGSLIL